MNSLGMRFQCWAAERLLKKSRYFRTYKQGHISLGGVHPLLNTILADLFFP
jgi:hypothetical protein